MFHTHLHTHTPELGAHPSGNQISLIRHMNYSKPREETKQMQMPIKLYNYKILKLNYG